MYIEFRLPSGAGGMAAGHTKQAIIKQLNSICTTYHIQLAQQVQQPYRFRVSFKQSKDYTIFALVWDIKNTYFKYTIWNEPIETAYNPKRYLP